MKYYSFIDTNEEINKYFVADESLCETEANEEFDIITNISIDDDNSEKWDQTIRFYQNDLPELDESTPIDSEESTVQSLNQDLDLYRDYIKDISNYAPLSHLEIQRLGAIIKKEANENGQFPSESEINMAKDMLAKHHAKYVVYIAWKLKYQDYNQIPIMTLIQEGNLGLLEAIKKWDYKKGLLTTFSNDYIRGRILKLFPISLPESEEKALHILNTLPTEAARRRKVRAWKLENHRRQTLDIAVRLDSSIDNHEDDENHENSKYEHIISSNDIDGSDRSLFNRSNYSEYDKTIQKLRAIKLEDNIQQSIFSELLIGTTEKKIKKKYNLSSEDYELFRNKTLTNVAIALSQKDLSSQLSQEERKQIYSLLRAVPSGDTRILNAQQKQYIDLFNFSENNASSPHSSIWKFDEKTFSNSCEKEVFFKELAQIKSVPCYKYVIRFLFNEYGIVIGADNENILWNYLDSNWSLSKQYSFEMEIDWEKVHFTKTHCALLMSFLYQSVQKTYEGNHLSLDSTKFKNIIMNLDSKNTENLTELALVYHMDLDIYFTFREKVMKIRKKDFLDQEFFVTFLVLKYADQCGITDWKYAFDKLNELYPIAEATNANSENLEVTSTIAFGNELLLSLEDNNLLKETYQTRLFTEKIEELDEIFQQKMIFENSNKYRSFEYEFKFQWNMLNAILSFEESTSVNLNEQKRKGTRGDKSYQVDSHKVQKFLYGNIAQDSKINASKFKDKYLGPVDSYLNSSEFNGTFIDDNIRMQFANAGNARRRNILLTVMFLKFSYDLNNPKFQHYDYQKRLALFKNRIITPLTKCGFMPLHSSNGYDAFLKLLLTCSNPLDLFRYVWAEKIKSLEFETTKEKDNERTLEQ